MVDIEEVGEQLRARRKALGMSQTEVAALNRVNRVTLSRLENGKLPEIGIRKVMAISATLGLELTLNVASQRPTLQDLVNEKEA
ncbi:MAG: helix-turn-helix domain-containing protein [Chlorobium sp.]|jgi:HTH-type transcriptional regulator / antitoxin HipB|nr:MAG: helix-turn-helix domain-containing protein [Chlorobium sp.]